MHFFETQARPTPNTAIVVQWMVAPENTDLNDIEIEIERSGSPNGPWKKLEVVDPNNTFLFEDKVAPQKPDSLGIYYRLRGVLKATGDLVEQGEAFTDTRVIPKYAREIQRQINILLRGVNQHQGFIGRKCTIYKKRNFGPRCRKCRDVVTRRVTISNCKECSGTGYAGTGYFNPVDVHCKVDPDIKQLNFGQLLKTDDRQTRVLLLDFPVLYPGDIIVEKSEKHWRVVNVDSAEDNERNTVVQFPAVIEIERGDVVYDTLRHSDNGGLRA